MAEDTGNGFVKKSQLIVAVVMMFLAMGTMVFRAGVVDAQMEARMNAIEKHVDYDDEVLARKDVVEQRLLYFEEEQKKIESHLDNQTEDLRDVLKKIRSR